MSLEETDLIDGQDEAQAADDEVEETSEPLDAGEDTGEEAADAGPDDATGEAGTTEQHVPLTALTSERAKRQQAENALNAVLANPETYRQAAIQRLGFDPLAQGQGQQQAEAEEEPDFATEAERIAYETAVAARKENAQLRARLDHQDQERILSQFEDATAAASERYGVTLDEEEKVHLAEAVGRMQGGTLKGNTEFAFRAMFFDKITAGLAAGSEPDPAAAVRARKAAALGGTVSGRAAGAARRPVPGAMSRDEALDYALRKAGVTT
jgi:hypothetical protein